MARPPINLDDYADEFDEPEVGVSKFERPEELLDHEDPANDRYFRHLSRLRAHVNVTSAKLQPRQVQAARLHVAGHTNKEIAEKLKYTPDTISKLVHNTPKVQELISLFRQVNAFIDGPNTAVRKNMLWRIAANSEQRDPGISITALKELNKLDGSYANDQVLQAPQVTIVINQDLLPKTSLDTNHQER
jgi:DNA-binding CsgD family transcriptional regulator